MSKREKMKHNGPLAGIKIIDCTTLIAGPLCTRILADQGADVIKVEPPGGDLVRYLGPELAPNFSATFLALGRNKRSIVMDLSHPAAQKLVLKLIADADVFIANSLPGVMARHGLDARTMQKRNPRLNYVSITGYGTIGPMAGQRAYDPIIQARSGMAMAKVAGKTAGLMPQTICDKLTGLSTAQAVCAALIETQKTGKGQEIELSLLGATLDFLAADMYWPIAAPDRDLPVADISNVYTPWDTQNGQIVFLVFADKEFTSLVDAFDCKALADDERFNSMAQRFTHWSDFQEVFKAKLASLSTSEALQKLKKAGIPSGPVNGLSDLVNDEQIKAMGAFREIQHEQAGRALQVQPGAQFHNHQAVPHEDAPGIGQHTAEVLSDLGISDTEIEKLFKSGAVT
jgi:crotonobetainyl-CoA:carnitine CoA-transferase CaiB-like acyl-CoA transferase